MKWFVAAVYILITIASCKKDEQEIDPFKELKVEDLIEVNSDIPYAPYSGLRFLTPLTGYAAGGNMLVKTSDGGIHWEVKKTWADLDLTHIQLINAKTIFILAKDASGTYLLKSSDEALTWQSIDAGIVADKHISGVYFTDQQTGFITGNSLFRKTSDGGISWTDVLPGTDDQFGDIFFIDNKEGFATASSGKYYSTSDGGRSWKLRSSDTNGNLGKIYSSPLNIYAKAGSSSLINLRTGKLTMTVPDIITDFIFITDKKIVGVGSHYESGFWPYGDILVTNDGWHTHQVQKYMPDIATAFRAASKAGDGKVIMLGWGHLKTPVITLNY